MDACCELSQTPETPAAPETTMSAEILQRLNDQGMLNAARLASLLNKTKSGAYRYYNTVTLDYHQLRTLIQHAGPEVGLTLLNGLTDGTPINHIYMDAELDFDGDGDVDTDDVLGHAIKANEAHAAYLREAITTKSIDLAKLGELKQQVLQGMAASESAAVHIATKQTKRRRCGQPLTRGGV